MKAKTLLLTLCSIFIIWSCDQDSSLFISGTNDKLMKTSIVPMVTNFTNNQASNSNPILYYVSFNSDTGVFTLFYLPRDIYELSFGSGSGETNGGGIGGSGGGNGGYLIEYIPPLNNLRPVPSHVTLNYKVDIYVTKDNKILYPPVYLPYCRAFLASDIKLDKNLLFERNQYPDAFINLGDYPPLAILIPEYEKPDKIIYKESDIIGQIEPVPVKNTVIYTIKNNHIYFHIYPDSYIFEAEVKEVDLGKIHLVNYDTTIEEVIHGLQYDINYDINIQLRLIKGDPPIIDPDDYKKFPVDKLYNIQVNETNKVIQVYDLTDKNNFIIDIPELNIKAYRNSTYFRNVDKTISLVDANGKQIIKYPNSYKLTIVPNLKPLDIP